MKLDYIKIINYAEGQNMSNREIAAALNASKSGVNDFLRAFRACADLSFPLPPGITNDAIERAVYGKPYGRVPDASFVVPDFEEVAHAMTGRSNMTLKHLWSQYRRRCVNSGQTPYSYRQFCKLYSDWCASGKLSVHFEAVPGQRMEVDFAGKTFQMVDRLTGETADIVVFVAVLPYSHCIYAEGMIDTKEPAWIQVNNNALKFFGGVAHLIVPDNCKQAVLHNRDWIAPELNPSCQEWANWNNTFLLPAKVRRPTFKSSVENAVGILEKGPFHELEDIPFFSLEDFNHLLFGKTAELNEQPFAKKPHSRNWYLAEEQKELLPLPPSPYEYAESKAAKVHPDSHIRYSNAYYSVPHKYVGKTVSVRATARVVRICDENGALLAEWERATRKGEWKTNDDHFPAWYRSVAHQDASNYLDEALSIGPNTFRLIERLIKSAAVPVQAFRQCSGILRYARTYCPQALEECCSQAIDANKVSYTYVRDTIAAVAEELKSDNPTESDIRNAGAYTVNPGQSSLDRLLAKTARMTMRGQEGEPQK